MKNIILLLTFLLVIYSGGHAIAQTWSLYDTSNSSLPNNQVQAIAIDKKDVKWIGTANGLARFDGMNWKIYTKDNSALPSSMIRALTIDIYGNVWIGTNKGLAKFDGVKWSVYTSLNSILSNDAITTVVSDSKSGNLWIGTEKGLVKFDGFNWSRFDDTNSGLITDFICSIAIDHSGTIWVGSFDHFQFAGRLYSFDGSNWRITRLEQKELNSSFPEALVIDHENILWMGIKGTMGGALVRIHGSDWEIINHQTSEHIQAGIKSVVVEGNYKWIGSGGGLISYNGAEFKNFNVSNSPLPDNFVYTLAIDNHGNKWIGTIYGGLALYKDTINETQNDNKDYILSIYPNPVRSSTTIFYNMPKKNTVTISIYNSAGVLVDIVQNEVAEKGNYSVIWSPARLANGVYFCTVKRGNKITTKRIWVK